MNFLLATFVVLVSAHQAYGRFSFRDTCAKRDLCWFGQNIACEEGRIRLCPGGQMIDLSPSEKQHLVDEHNRLRNDLATGQVSGYSPAARMGAMTWDDELAQMIDLNIRRCKYGHDSCRSTVNYPMSGQNLAYIKGYDHGTFNRAAVVKEFDTMISDWFAENKDANMDQMRNFRSNGPVITHFTGMSIDKNVRVGCAGVWYPEDDTGRVNFGCNYAFLTMQDAPVYVEGSPASQCQTGTDRQFPGLCSTNESY